MRMIFPVWALVAWGLTALLVSQLLGGTFEVRSCQSGCVWVIYWITFAVNFAGCVVGAWRLTRRGAETPWFAFVSVASMFVLLGIFTTTMLIGEFG